MFRYICNSVTGLAVEKNLPLTSLDLGYNDLSSVPSEILVAAISDVKLVTLTQTKLTSEQTTAIYRMVADRRCSMFKIDLWDNNINHISQDLLDRAKLNRRVIMIDDRMKQSIF